MTWNTPTYSSSDIARMQEAAVYAAREMNRRAQRAQAPEGEGAPSRRQNDGWNGWQRREEGFATRGRPGENGRRPPEARPPQENDPQAARRTPAGATGTARQPGRNTQGYGQSPGEARRTNGEPMAGRAPGNRQQPGMGNPPGNAGQGGSFGGVNRRMGARNPGAPQGEMAHAQPAGNNRPYSPPPAGNGWQNGASGQRGNAPQSPYGQAAPPPQQPPWGTPRPAGSPAWGPQMNHTPPSSGLFSSGGPLGSLGGLLGGAVSGVTDGLGSLLGSNGDAPSPISKVLDALNLDTERIIILILALVLLNEKADYTLILALVYLFF